MLNRGAAQPRDSRVLVLSHRRVAVEPWQASQYEFEDLLTTLDDVELLVPEAEDHADARIAARRVTNAVSRRVGRARTQPLWPATGMRRTPVTTSHDLFFGVFHHAHQLSYLHRVPGWRQRCRRAVCVLIEVWSPELEPEADYLALLREFDEVYVFNPVVARELAARGGPRVQYLPLAVDALSTSPLPLLPERVVDVYSYGRRSPGIHRELLELVERDGLTYLYDTLTDARVTDHREHRLLLANVMKRSRYFLAHAINDTAERRARTGGDEALSTRYLEGAAGGVVMLGSRPEGEVFDEVFPHEDAVVPLPYEGGGVADLLADLERDPERVARIRAAGAAGSLLRHDWAHRWQRVLDDVGLAAQPALQERVDRLDRLAQTAVPEAFLAAERSGPSSARTRRARLQSVRTGAEHNDHA